MYLILFTSFFIVQGFILKPIIRSNRISRFNNDPLLDIDKQIQIEKMRMKKLLYEKNKILINKTGVEFYNKSYIDDYIDYITKENIYDDFDEEGFNNEYDFEYKPRQSNSKPNINYNIIITNKKSSNSDIEQSPTIRSENFEVIVNSTYNFNDIGGYDLIKEELMQCADMLVNYTKYTKYNVRIPKGIILEGPPGNGKTLMAKCFSGEIKIAFIPVSGAQFQEKYVGVGGARVRELFTLASDNVPCIIFIDELDAIGRKRSSESNSNSNIEHDSTLNELLVNLDGFKSIDGVFIIGATNRIDLLDTALIRPGRIDKKIYIGNPDRKTREQILNIHLINKPLNNKIKMEYLLELTNGFSGAQIENFLNEAMLYILRQNRFQIEIDDLNIIANRILVGFQPTKNKLTDNILYQVAVHEIGHALIGLMTTHKKLIKITINLWSPTTLGYTLFEPNEQSNNIQTKEQLITEIMILLGGRIAEEIIFNNNYVSSGASHDLDQVKKIASHMINNLGMGNKLIICNEIDKDKEIDMIISTAYDRAKILLTNAELLIKDCAQLLIINNELQPKTIINLITNRYPYIKLGQTFNS